MKLNDLFQMNEAFEEVSDQAFADELHPVDGAFFLEYFSAADRRKAKKIRIEKQYRFKDAFFEVMRDMSLADKTPWEQLQDQYSEMQPKPNANELLRSFKKKTE